MSTKTNPGNFFEDFTVGQVIQHATPRTVTEGDRAVYGSLYPTRFAIPSSAAFASAVGLDPHPVEDLIAFHIAFGKTVPDISLNAVANLGYAGCRFLHPVFAGDTLSATSEVIGCVLASPRMPSVPKYCRAMRCPSSLHVRSAPSCI